MDRVLSALVAVVLLAGFAGCSSPDGGATDPPTRESPVEFDQDLHDELVAMAKQDQVERTGGGTMKNEPRTERLKEIIAEHGWPTFDLVGEGARTPPGCSRSTPTSTRTSRPRHSSCCARPQLYGTQTGCARNGTPAEPEIEDPANLDERREAAGLPPYERYLKQMTRVRRQG